MIFSHQFTLMSRFSDSVYLGKYLARIDCSTLATYFLPLPLHKTPVDEAHGHFILRNLLS
jgi:hypothetical protein